MAQMWEVVGGEGKGGILVRTAVELVSPQTPDRLSTGALIRELELVGERLHYALVEGTGPADGWISIKLKDKDLAVRSDKTSDIPPDTGVPGTVGPNGESPLPIGLMFPGQGSQYVKMMTGVQDIPAVKAMLESAKDILGWDVLDLCLNGPEEKLEQTRYCQPAMFIAGLAGVEKLRADREEAINRAQVVAGLSLGEYTALCVAGVFTFEQGLQLVKLRGEAMQEAATIGKQLMLSVAGLEKSLLEGLCKEAAKKEGSGAVCCIANALFPNGFSCSGTEVAINELQQLSEKAGALQAKVLKTGGAFHSSLMQPAADRLGAAIDELLPEMKPPMYTVWMNATATPVRPGTDPSLIVPLMKKQLTSSVLWEPSAKAIIAEGVTEFYEVGPMKQMKAMMKRIDVNAWKKTTTLDI